MFESFYQMTHTPFARGIPVEDMYESETLTESAGRLLYAGRNRRFAVLTGECGTGKSSLLRKVSRAFENENIPVIYVCDGALTPGVFYREALFQLGLPLRRSRADARRELFQALRTVSGLRDRSPVCICDESHLFSPSMLEEIRFVLNQNFDSAAALGLILCGQNELATKLKLPECRAVHQRIDIRCALFPFELSQTSGYIAAHLKYAGGTREIFTDAAIGVIHEASAGVARMIDKICTALLLYGGQTRRDVLDDSDARFVIRNEFA